MALGSYPDLTLERARELHKAMRGMLKSGLDPMQVRKSEKDHFTQRTKAPVVMTTVRVVKDEKGKKLVKVTPVINSFHWVYLQWYETWSTE